MDIGSLLYALVIVFHPDWLIRLNFLFQVSDNLHTDSHQTCGCMNKNQPLEVAKNIVRTYSLTNAASPGHEERALMVKQIMFNEVITQNITSSNKMSDGHRMRKFFCLTPK